MGGPSWDSVAAEALLEERVAPAGWINPEGKGKYDLVVIGAGSAGLVTAAGAAGLGARVALIEARRLGGDCLNHGCVPSKAILRSARSLAEARDAASLGLKIDGEHVEADFPQVMARMRSLRARLATHDSAERFRGLGIDVFLGRGRFVSRESIEVGGRRLAFGRACIATGSAPAIPQVPGLAETGYLTNETLFSLEELPPRLLVMGGGPVGCEMAQAMARLGSRVTLVQSGPRLLASAHEDAAEIVAEALRRDGVDVILGGAVERFEQGRARLRGGRSIDVDAVLVATGRRPGIGDLGLEEAGIEADPARGIVVDDFLRTTNRRVWAAGDCCTRARFTHAADAMARIVIRNALFFGRERVSRLVMPSCTFTDPEVAQVGIGLDEARAKDAAAQEIRIELRDVDRAVLDGEEQGFLSLVVSRKGKLFGATLVSRHAGETISEITATIVAGGDIATLGRTIHPYPVQADIIRRAADAWNRQRLTPRAKRILGAIIAFRR